MLRWQQSLTTLRHSLLNVDPGNTKDPCSCRVSSHAKNTLGHAHKPGQHGFTVIELLIAITVFAFAIPALSAGVNGLIAANNRSRDLTLISLTAEDKIEELRSTGFNALNVGTYDFSSELPPELSRPKSASYTIANATDDIKTITIVINYWDYTRAKTVTYKSAVSELGVSQ